MGNSQKNIPDRGNEPTKIIENNGTYHLVYVDGTKKKIDLKEKEKWERAIKYNQLRKNVKINKSNLKTMMF